MQITTRSPETAQIALQAQTTLATWMHMWQSRQLQTNYIPETVPTALAQVLDQTVLDTCLEINMDGGAAELVGPRFPMENRYSYTLSAEMSCDQLDGHGAWIELHLLNAAGEMLQILRTDTVAGTQAWQKHDTEIASPPGTELKWGQIHLKVEPHNSAVLAGTARFDSINIYRMPRLSLHTSLKYHIAEPGQEFDVSCEAMGIREDAARVHFILQDHLGHTLREQAAQLQVTDSAGVPSSVSDEAELAEAVKSEGSGTPSTPYYVSTGTVHRCVDGRSSWHLNIDEPGLYRLRVNLAAGSGDAQQRELLLGVMHPTQSRTSGPFGWSLPQFGPHLNIDEVPDLVSRFGAGWIKIPVWFDPADTLTAEKLVALIERLQAQGTQVVGKLDQPPPRLREAFGDNQDYLYAVNIFRDPKDWEPALEPVLTRIGMKLPWFQIGDDGDHSFVGKSELAETVAALRQRMQTYSQELKLALNWTWLDPAPTAAPAPWNAIHYTTLPQNTAAELEQYIAHAPREGQLWVSIDPLAGKQYALLDRVRDLTQRMLAIKRSTVTGAFVSNPFRPELRLFTAEKTIGEMLIPWHELVNNLGDAAYVGAIELPGHSTNHVLANGEKGLMLIWNDRPTSEQLYLGDVTHATDLFGGEVVLEQVQSERGTPEIKIPVDPWPIIVHGVNLDLIHFHQQFALQVDSLDSSNLNGQSIPVSITNTLPQSATGKVTVISPSLLSGDRSESPLQLSNALTQKKSLPLFIRNDASAGEHRLRFDFDLMSNKPYQFSIYRTTTLGSGEIELTWDAIRRPPDQLDLRVEIRNNTEQAVAFDCKLFPPGRPYVRFRINDSKPGVTVQELRLLLNEVPDDIDAWLRCEQIGTGHVLNYRLKL